MPTTKETWDQVGESWRDLGRHLRDQCQKLSEDQAKETHEDRAKLNEAANKLSEHVGEALSSLRGLVKDPATKESMDRVVQATGAAISATFDAAAAEIRQHLPGVESAEPAKVPAPPSPSEEVKASSN
jgi:hypothetical protein